MKVLLQSVITCPNCGHKKEETMPTDSCQFFYECESCKTVLKPLPGTVAYIAVMEQFLVRRFNKIRNVAN